MRRALLAAQGAADDLEAFESVVEQDGVVSGTNFHFVRGAGGGRKGGACFEADDNKAHPDGSVTLRTDLDHAAAATDLSDVLFVTNVYRKRYEPGSCDRYDSMRATVEAMTGPEGATLTLADLRRMMNAVEFRGGLVETFHTVLFKPSDFTLTVARIGPDHWASEDPGVTVPPDVLFPWKDAR